MQVGSKILFNAVKRISNDFPILKEARREVMEDLMDYQNAQKVIDEIIAGRTVIVEEHTEIPSPFAFSLIAGGYSDVIKIEDKQEFLKRMHEMVMAKIALKEGKQILKEKREEFSYTSFWADMQKKQEEEKDWYKEKMKLQVWTLKQVPVYVKEELIKLIDNGSMRKDVFDDCRKYKEEIEQNWPQELKEFMLGKMSAV